ncbi:MAG: hypothetical protein IID16_05195 [Candidatus Marinimicrobia bacterium]|nr:hypothetical protein [Candidatus Neomarinimicrobiota bacterium]
MMNCLEARKTILSKDTNAIDADISVAKQHVDTCRDCQQILKQQEGFKRILKARLSGQPAPTALREKILASVAAERLRNTVMQKRTHFKRRSFIWTGAAAVLLILLFMIYQNLIQPKIEYASPAVHALAQDHIASKLRENPLDLWTTNTAELERWFSMRVDFAVRIPTLDNLTLLGGRLCLINGERVVSLAFHKQSVPITLYIMDRDVIDLARIQVIDPRDQKPIFHGDAKGCNVIIWEEKGLIFSLVSDMNENELVELVAKS